MNTTKIQWTDMSWNPIRATRADNGQRISGHYCEKISPGCANCYASNLQKRFTMPEFPGRGGNGLSIVTPFLDEKKLREPLKKRTPQKVFVCDMSDLFGEWVSDDWINRIFGIMENSPQHTFQVLTKRAKRMAHYINWRWGEGRIPCRHIWLGVSIEDRRRLDERSMALASSLAVVPFWSVEPLLEDLINIRGYLEQGVKWVIVGGESGRKARPCDVEWVRSVVQQCREYNVACFVKQLGSYVVDYNTTSAEHFPEEQCWPDGTRVVCRRILLKDSKGGDPAEWPEDLRVREFPATARETAGAV